MRSNALLTRIGEMLALGDYARRHVVDERDLQRHAQDAVERYCGHHVSGPELEAVVRAYQLERERMRGLDARAQAR